MKKVLYIICILLSLFIVGCSEPENTQLQEEIELVVDISMFGDKVASQIEKLGLSYGTRNSKAMSKPLIIDVSEDGKVSFGKIAHKGERLDFDIIAYAKGGKEIVRKSGSITPDGRKATIELGSEKIVLKVRNADLPKGSVSLTLDAYGDIGNLFESSVSMEVQKGEFTVIPVDDAFMKAFKADDKVEFACVGIQSTPDSGEKDDVIVISISYEPGKSEYIIEKPSSTTVTIKVGNSMYYQTVTGYRWKSDFEPDTFTVSRAEGEYTVLGTVDLPPMYGGASIYIEVLGEGNAVIGSGWSYFALEKGKTEYLLDKPTERLARNIEIASQDYMLPVSEYAFRFRDEYHDGIVPADSGNTVLFTASDLSDGEEYELIVYNKNRGEYTVIGKGVGKIHVDGDSRNIVLEPTVIYGAMKMNCQPTFRTDMVFWKLQKKDSEGNYVKYPGTYSWNPEWPQKDTTYLEPGDYKIVNLYSDEHANGSNQGAWGLTLPDQEISIASGETTVVESQFLEYQRMSVKFRVKTTFEYVGAVKMGIRLEFKNKTYCDCQAYSQVTEHFDYDSNTKEIFYTWWGIPTDTDVFYLTLYLGGSEHKKNQFTLADINNGEIYWDSTK